MSGFNGFDSQMAPRIQSVRGRGRSPLLEYDLGSSKYDQRPHVRCERKRSKEWSDGEPWRSREGVRGETPPRSREAPWALREYLDTEEEILGQPEVLPDEEIESLAKRLYETGIDPRERQRILVFLARQGSPCAIAQLRRFVELAGSEVQSFARLALEEALVLSEQPKRIGRNDACPCGSGRKFKDCCAAKARLT
jgi:hypothetical protein